MADEYWLQYNYLHDFNIFDTEFFLLTDSFKFYYRPQYLLSFK